MAYNVGFNDQVNGGVRAGEFLTGNMDFYTIATLVPVAQTNVTTPVSLLYTQQGYSTWQSVSITDGTGTAQTYSTQSDYSDALKKQQNLNLLIQLFTQRAVPVAISLSSTTGTAPNTAGLFPNFSYAATFGSNYSSTASVIYTVKFATEKSGAQLFVGGGGTSYGGLWQVSGTTAGVATNDAGYQLLDALQGITVQDLASAQLQTTVFETLSSANRNTLAYRGMAF